MQLPLIVSPPLAFIGSKIVPRQWMLGAPGDYVVTAVWFGDARRPHLPQLDLVTASGGGPCGGDSVIRIQAFGSGGCGCTSRG